MNKKGLLYIFISIVLVLVLILLFTVQTKLQLKNKMDVIEIRIDTLNDFVKSVDEDLDRSVFISGYRSILAMTNEISITGIYIDDVQHRFKEGVLNGTYNGSFGTIMNNATLINWADRMKEVAGKIGVVMNISIHDVSLSQNDPWTLLAIVNVTLNISDIKKTAQWNKTLTKTTKISITGFEDPLYLIESFGRATNMIIKSNSTDFSDVTFFKDHVNNSRYIASNSAPSFWQRLEGDLSNSSNGIESIVNINELKDQGIPTFIKSHVDHIYFSDNDPDNCQINETNGDPELNFLHLDLDSLSKYSASCI